MWSARAFGLDALLAAPWTIVGIAMPLLAILYYLVWKFLVGFLNEALGIA